MATKHVTTTVNGVPKTTTIKVGSGKGPVKDISPDSSKVDSALPPSTGLAKSSGGIKDAIRAPGDTRYTDQFGEDADFSAAQGKADSFADKAPGGVNVPNVPVTPGIQNATGANPAAMNNAPVVPPPVATPAAAPTPTQTKYQQGFAAAQASGQPAPSDAGQARGLTASYIPQTPDTTGVDQFLSSDPAINTLMSGITQLLNPQKQTSTLMQDYQKLYKQSGLKEINQEIIDAETVINGTEDDIRNEIQTAGGFGTESQVQAMSLARNKSLLTRYNQLVQMKTDATNQLNTLSQLNVQDKQMAQAKIDSQINTMFKMADFRQQATKNVQEAFNNMVAKVGYAGAYAAYASDPRQLGFIEQTMGLQPGGLKTLSTQRDLDREEKLASIEASKASAANSYANAAETRAKIAAAGAPSKAIATQVSKIDSTLTKIKEVQNLLPEGQLTPTGFVGGITKNIPGTQAYNLNKTISTIKANLSFDTLAEMRAASPTGGALGAISDKEIELLGSTVANLDVGQDAKTLKNNLQQVQTHYENWLNANGYVVLPNGDIQRLAQ